MLFKTCVFVVVCLLLGNVCGQMFNDLDDSEKSNQNPDLKDIENKLEESGINVPNFNRTKIDPKKIENALREKCKNQDAPDAVDILKDQQDTLRGCISEQVNATQLQEELDESKKTGSMDEVFAKYCKKWPAVYGCFENATITVRQCMTDKEKKAFNKTLDIVEEFQQFMCHKDGDRLAMFVAEGGVECLHEQQEGLRECLNKTVGARIPETDDLNIATLPTFLFTEKDCLDFDKVRVCVNGVLEKCKDTTPANIVDASFKFLKKQMDCEAGSQERALKVEASPVQGNTADQITSSLVFVLVGYLLLAKV